MVSVLFCDRGSFGVNSGLQVEIGNVELEPESVEQDSGIEDARGIDRLESRYAGVKPFLCSSVSGYSFQSVSMDGRQSGGASAELCFGWNITFSDANAIRTMVQTTTD